MIFQSKRDNRVIIGEGANAREKEKTVPEQEFDLAPYDSTFEDFDEMVRFPPVMRSRSCSWVDAGDSIRLRRAVRRGVPSGAALRALQQLLGNSPGPC